LGGLRLSTPKQDGHGGLCGLGHRSIIPYVYGIMRVIVLFKCWLFLSVALSGL
jgi:hypothetical protein